MSDGHAQAASSSSFQGAVRRVQVLKDKDMPLVSSVFFMCLPDKVLVYGDCAINVDPSSAQLAHIAVASADTATAFGIEPRVAMLSYSTLGSGSGPQVEKITEAVRLVREMRPDLKLTGPIQYDAATNERIAAVKVKNDKDGVAGMARALSLRAN
jgi:phosphate acetyltransferase